VRWYGYQSLLCEAAAAAQFLSGVALDAGPLYVTGGITYLGCTPIIHLLHAQYSYSGLSMGLRIVGPGLGAIMGFGIGSAFPTRTNETAPTETGALIGGAVGAAAIMAVDSLLLAYEIVPVWEREGTAGGWRRLRLSPMGLTGLQLGASF
jgi:hypothetical protein